MILQGDVALTENIPGAASPAPSVVQTPVPAQMWDTARRLSFKILPTNTTLAAATSSSSADNLTHRKLSAE
ncbi:MAG: hypothetical protein ACR2K5_04885 [Pseudolabrys sp.]